MKRQARREYDAGPADWGESSPIEATFRYHLVDVLGPRVKVSEEFEVMTRDGPRRLDFLLTLESDRHAVAIECDGVEFHAAADDACRDAAILRTGVCSVVVHLPGALIFYQCSHVMAALWVWFPWMFSEASSERFRKMAAFDSAPWHFMDDHTAIFAPGGPRCTITVSRSAGS
jgi:hypothetical protein